MDIPNVNPSTGHKPLDLRGFPTHICVCGSCIWNLKVVFYDYEIVQYFIDMECALCGSLATAPTPEDKI